VVSPASNAVVAGVDPLRHVDGVGAGAHPEQFAHEVTGLTDASGAEGELAGIPFQLLDQISHGPGWRLGIDHQHVRKGMMSVIAVRSDGW
jgi:hypothetical protein